MTPPSVAVTIIVPVHNEESRIGRCLDSILANDFPRDQLEILVVDGMSTDRSRTIIAEYARHFNCIHLIDNPETIVSTGLNLGIRQARGTVIIIMGAHSEYPGRYISTCVRRLATTDADVVGGMLNTQPGGDTLIARAIALMTQHSFGVGRAAFRTRDSDTHVDTVPYAAYRRGVFDRAGLFNERLSRNQDFEFNARVRSTGGKLLLSRDLEVTYYNVPTVKRLAVQAFKNGFWVAKMWYTSPLSFRLRHAAPLGLVSILLAALLISPFVPAAGGITVAVSMCYVLAALTAASQISYREGWSYFLPLIGLFVTHHVSYGLGTITGLLYPVRLTPHHSKTRLTEAAST